MKLKICSIVSALFLIAVFAVSAYAEMSPADKCVAIHGDNQRQIDFCLEDNLLVNKKCKIPIRPWVTGKFLDCAGEPAERGYVLMSSVGKFVNSNPGEEICYADVVLFKCTNNDMGIFIHEFAETNEPLHLLGPGAYVKAQNNCGKTVTIPAEDLRKWRGNEGILLTSQPLRSLLFRSPGVVSFEVYDGYETTYGFMIDADDLTRTYNNM